MSADSSDDHQNCGADQAGAEDRDPPPLRTQQLRTCVRDTRQPADDVVAGHHAVGHDGDTARHAARRLRRTGINHHQMIRCRTVERHLTGSPIQGTSREPKFSPERTSLRAVTHLSYRPYGIPFAPSTGSAESANFPTELLCARLPRATCRELATTTGGHRARPRCDFAFAYRDWC